MVEVGVVEAKYPKIIYITPNKAFLKKWWTGSFMLFKEVYNGDATYIHLFKGDINEPIRINYYSYLSLIMEHNPYFKVIKQVYEDDKSVL